MTDQQFNILISSLNTMNSNLCAIARKIDEANTNIERLQEIVDGFPR